MSLTVLVSNLQMMSLRSISDIVCPGVTRDRQDRGVHTQFATSFLLPGRVLSNPACPPWQRMEVTKLFVIQPSVLTQHFQALVSRKCRSCLPSSLTFTTLACCYFRDKRSLLINYQVVDVTINDQVLIFSSSQY